MNGLIKTGISLLLMGIFSDSVSAQIEKIFDLSDFNGKNYGFSIEGESADDQFGRAILYSDINGDGFEDLIVAASQRNESGSNRGSVYVIFGGEHILNEIPGLADLNGTNGLIIKGEFDTGSFGSRLASGDINGDNIQDLIVADPGASPFGRPSTAAVYVLFGKTVWTDSVAVSDFDGTDGFRIYGDRHEDPEYIASGDLNDDGFDEVIIGSDYSGDPDQFAGRTTIIYGKASGFPDEISSLERDYSSHGAVLRGTVSEDRFGHGLATGDFNNDGKTDLFASAPFYHRNFGEKGRVYVVLGNDTTYTGFRGITNLTDETNGFILSESSSGCCHYAGQELEAGDTNGDGYDDIIIGSPNFYMSSSVGRAGRVVVYRGNVSTTNESFGKTNGTFHASINGITENDKTGYAVEVADINLDGNDDILIGAYNARLDGSTYTGAVYAVYGPVLTDIDLEDLSEDQGFVLRGDPNSRTGIDVSTGDMNNDGIPEIAIGAYHNNPNGSESGEVYILTNMATQTIHGDEGFRMMSAPVQGKSIGAMFGDLWVQGLENSDAPDADANLWQWSYVTQSWVPLNDLEEDSVLSGFGILSYVFDDDDADGVDDGFPKQVQTPGSLYPINYRNLRPSKGGFERFAITGFFLLGNIFPFAIDWDKSDGSLSSDGFRKADLTNTIYSWSDSASTWYTYNGITGNKPDSGLIHPFQSVFIKAVEGESGYLRYDRDSKADTQTGHLKRSRKMKNQSLSIHIETKEFKNAAFIAFHDKGEWERDIYDSDLLVPMSASYIQMGIFQNGDIYTSLSLPQEELIDYEFPLYAVASGASSDALFSVATQNFPQNFSISLRDTKTGIQTDLAPDDTIRVELANKAKKKIERQLPPIPEPVAKKMKTVNSRYRLILSKKQTTSTENETDLTFTLKQNYPNPFNPSTTIAFQLPAYSVVKLQVFDITGREVAKLLDKPMTAGDHEVVFNAENLPSGFYIYRLRTGSSDIIRKMLLVK